MSTCLSPRTEGQLSSRAAEEGGRYYGAGQQQKPPWLRSGEDPSVRSHQGDGSSSGGGGGGGGGARRDQESPFSLVGSFTSKKNRHVQEERPGTTPWGEEAGRNQCL